jgi:membrane associated rhomboid family serine protease
MRDDMPVDTASDLKPIKPPREPIFNRMPIGVASLIGIILAVHIIGLVANEQTLSVMGTLFGVVPQHVLGGLAQGQVGAPLTALIGSQFLHAGNLHLVMNLAMLLQAGPIAELGLNRNKDEVARFIIFFLVCGIFGGLAYCWINPASLTPTIGASGAISGVFAGFLWAAIGLAKPGQAMLRPVLTSAVVFLLINVGLAWVGRVTNFLPIAWESHLGGFIAGLVLYPIMARMGRARASHS